MYPVSVNLFLGDPLVKMPLGMCPWLGTAQVGMHVPYQWIYFRVSVGHEAARFLTLNYYRTSLYACLVSVDLFLGDPLIEMPLGKIDSALLQHN